jgi:hypothetical protein
LNGVQSIVDIGCGDGALLRTIGRLTGAEIFGLDLRALPCSSVKIVQGDAASSKIPNADAAYSTFLFHHLTEQQIIDVIHNVGQSCKRFIILDLIRHPLPFSLFTVFISPFLSKGAAADGRLSIRRAYTPAEMHAVVARALEGSDSDVEHWVSPYLARQIVTIDYKKATKERIPEI